MLNGRAARCRERQGPDWRIALKVRPTVQCHVVRTTRLPLSYRDFVYFDLGVELLPSTGTHEQMLRAVVRLIGKQRARNEYIPSAALFVSQARHLLDKLLCVCGRISVVLVIRAQCMFREYFL